MKLGRWLRNCWGYAIKPDAAAIDRPGGFRVGKSDELVTTLGLAVQAEPPVWSVDGEIVY